MTTNEPAPSAQRKMEGLHALANIAEREGRLDAARALSEWADATAPFVPYTDEEMRRLGLLAEIHSTVSLPTCAGCGNPVRFVDGLAAPHKRGPLGGPLVACEGSGAPATEVVR